MISNREFLKNELSRLLIGKKGKRYYSKRLGITISEVEKLLEEIRPSKMVRRIGDLEAPQSTPETINITGYYDHPPKPEEIAKDHNIDPKTWKLSNYWSKQKSDGKYQVSALFSQIKQKSEDINKEFLQFLKTYKSSYKPINYCYKSNRLVNPCSLLISLPDLHLDKLTIDNISIENKIDAYTQVLDNLLSRSYNSHNNIEEVVFVIGNDFLHTDTFWGTTTKGTPVGVNSTWDKSYEKGFDLLVSSIIKLKTFSKKIKVILIPGNHARTKEFYLTHALEAYFKLDKDIIFDRGAEDLKIHKYGETLLCFSHGNNINDKLPLVFASQFYKEWGQCKYKEIVLGDKHHNSEKLIKSQGETAGVRMRILPALCGTDSWHRDNLYIGAIQSGIALIYDKIKGKISEFEERI